MEVILADLVADHLDPEDILLLHLSSSRMPEHLRWPRLNLDALSEEECLHLFRFKREDIYRLQRALGIADSNEGPIKLKWTGIEGLCILLRRLAYPSRLADLVPIFGRSKSEIGLIFNAVLEDVYTRHNHLLSNLDNEMLRLENLRRFAQVIHEKGAPLKNCWGFIDGTARGIARPGVGQRACFSGHKRIHVLKFQSVIVPNGIIANLFGPLEGRRHDAAMLAESGLLPRLERMPLVDGTPLCIYGDPAYPLRPNLIGPFKGHNLTGEEKLFNKKMSSLRECVEWGFGKIVQYFAFLDFKKNQKLYLQPVGKYYIVATILINCHTCLYGSLTGAYFDMDPPSLEEYLRL